MKSKIAAALLALFVGWLGIHKFYLGETVAGVIYLLFSWTFIPGLIGFFEFIGLLVMSDQAFDLKYNSAYVIQPSSPKFIESSQDKTATLMELKKLYDHGVITAEEYEEKRRKYLESL